MTNIYNLPMTGRELILMVGGMLIADGVMKLRVFPEEAEISTKQIKEDLDKVMAKFTPEEWLELKAKLLMLTQKYDANGRI